MARPLLPEEMGEEEAMEVCIAMDGHPLESSSGHPMTIYQGQEQSRNTSSPRF